jgi:hypothetical protein
MVYAVDDLEELSPEDRREVNPPIEVDVGSLGC